MPSQNEKQNRNKQGADSFFASKCLSCWEIFTYFSKLTFIESTARISPLVQRTARTVQGEECYGPGKGRKRNVQLNSLLLNTNKTRKIAVAYCTIFNLKQNEIFKQFLRLILLLVSFSFLASRGKDNTRTRLKPEKIKYSLSHSF